MSNNSTTPTNNAEEKKKRDGLIVVAALITTLSYQIGTNIPGGYWQGNSWLDGKMVIAGDPIMRDRDRIRYWTFMTSSWTGFASSSLITICLLSGIDVKERLVRWPFFVTYPCLVLSFITTQVRTPLPLDLILWVVVLVVIWLIVRGSHGMWPFNERTNTARCGLSTVGINTAASQEMTVRSMERN